MAVYREGYHIIREIQKASIQIFPDACDFGAPVKQKDSIWNSMRQLIEWYGVNGTREENRYDTGRSVSQKILLTDEWAVSDGRKNEEEAIETYYVEFTSCIEGKCKGFDGYIYVRKEKL